MTHAQQIRAQRTTNGGLVRVTLTRGRRTSVTVTAIRYVPGASVRCGSASVRGRPARSSPAAASGICLPPRTMVAR